VWCDSVRNKSQVMVKGKKLARGIMPGALERFHTKITGQAPYQVLEVLDHRVLQVLDHRARAGWREEHSADGLKREVRRAQTTMTRGHGIATNAGSRKAEVTMK
jgi:hypothetical protein